MPGPLPVLAAAALVLGLAHCAAPGTERPRPADSARPVAVVPAADADVGQLVNRARRAGGLAPLRAHPALQRTAAAHVRDMAANDFVGHKGSDGSGLRVRGRRQGYRACWFGENVAAGQRSAQEVVEDWLASPTHRRIMLHRRAAEYGVARGPQDNWALVVAQPGCR